MKSTYDIEKLTAYLLEELDDSQKKEVEDILEENESAKAALEELRQAVELSIEAFGGSAASQLSLKDEQRAKVRKSAKDSPHQSAGEKVEDALFGEKKGDLFKESEDADEAPSFAFGNDLFQDQGEEPKTNENLNPFGEVAEDSPPAGKPKDGPVLFSLGNLQALATDEPKDFSSPEGFASQAGADPQTAEEASGLIDIRSLAGAIEEEDESDLHDLISLRGADYSPELKIPTLAVVQSGLSTNMKIGIVASAAALVAVIVVVVVISRMGGNEEADAIAKLQAQLEQIQKEGAGAAEVDKLKEQLADAKEDKENENEASADTAAEESAEGEKTEETSHSDKGSKNGSPKGRKPSSKPASSSDDKSSSPSSRPKPSSSSSGGNELDDLLGGSSPKPSSPKPSSSSSSGGGGAKPSLDRADVQKGMNGVAGRVKQCGQGQSGSITIKAVIGTSGRVVSAVATGPFAGTPVGSCAARAVRAARFPRSQKNLTVRYPFKL